MMAAITRTTWFSAVSRGNERELRQLTYPGANINVKKNGGYTALMLAAEKGKEEVVRALIDAGADVNVTENGGYNALMLVARNGKEEVARALIDAGADVNATNNEGYTALILAARNGEEKVARALIDAGADANATNNEGYTALMLAARNGREVVARAMIDDAGADVNATNNEGYTALMLAARNGKEEVARALIDAGADVNATNNEGYTVLMLAAINGHGAVTRVLIDAGADVNATNNEGYIALMLAARNGEKEVARALIDAGADVNVTNNDGYTALMLAAEEDKEEVACVLIDTRADVNVTNNAGYTALMLAAKYGHEAVTRVLIDDGKAFVNARDAYGRTPLFYAITKSLNVAGFLLDKGACLHDTDDYNVSILSFCIEHRLENHSRLPSTEASEPGLVATLIFLEKKGLHKEAIFHSVLNVMFCHAISACVGISVSPISQSIMSITDVVDALTVVKKYIKSNKKKGTIENIIKVFREFNIPKLLDLLIQSGANPNSVDSQGNTALHYATLLPFCGVTQDVVLGICLQLNQIGVKFNLKNHQMETPLLFCLSRRAWKLATKYERWLEIKTVVEVCQFLLKCSSRLISDTTRNGESVFHLILNLLKDILPLNGRTTNEETSIHLCKSWSVVKLLVESGANTNDAETRGIGLQEAVKLFKLFSPPKVTKGVTVNKIDYNFNSPLHLWASLSLATAEEYTGNVTNDSTFENILQTILMHLLSCGVKLNARNTNEETPLHLCKTWSAVKLLVESGANTNDLDSRRRSPLLFAAKNHVFTVNSDHFYPDVQDDQVLFFETCLKMGLDPWTCDDDGESVLSILLESEVFALVNAMIEVACQENHTKLESLLETICKDKSTRTYWKSTVVEKMLKSRSVKFHATAALRYCCMNIKELHDKESTKSDAPVSAAESDSRRESKSIDDEEMKKPRNAHSKYHSFSSSVHWEIAKQLLLYGADGSSCEDIARNYPELNDLLTNEIDINDVPKIIPWTSYSTTHKVKLERVARRQNYDTVGTYWYHQDPIGSGSFGHVFAGINEKDGREVAIKKIEKLRMVQPQDKREIRNLTALADCQQVVRYIFFDENDRSFAFVVLELMEGHLDDYIESEYFDARESTSLCKDVAMGLKYLHEHEPKPILHRDLKPGNILYKAHPKLCLKIADFGLSSPIDGASNTTVLGTNVGTRCWVAPEVIRSTNHQHSMSSDVFACGLILHYILSLKKHPFTPADCKNKSEDLINLEIQQNMLNNNMEGLNNCLSPEATHLVKQMLDSHETQRPSAADALNQPMFWSNKKKMDFLSAVGNQQEIKCPVIGHLNAVETDLEATLPTIVKHTTWNDAMYTHMPDIHYEMTQPIVRTDKKGKLHTVPPKKYNTGSIVELIRFIRNSIAHASDASRPSLFSKQILEDCVFLDEFPSLVLEVFKVVTKHGWDAIVEIKTNMNQ